MDSAGVWQIQAHFLPIFQQICYRPPYTHVRAMVSKMSVPNYNETKDDYSMSSILFTCDHHHTRCPRSKMDVLGLSKTSSSYFVSFFLIYMSIVPKMNPFFVNLVNNKNITCLTIISDLIIF